MGEGEAPRAPDLGRLAGGWRAAGLAAACPRGRSRQRGPASGRCQRGARGEESVRLPYWFRTPALYARGRARREAGSVNVQCREMSCFGRIAFFKPL